MVSCAVMAADEPNREEKPHPTIPIELSAIVRAGARAAREVPGAIALGGTVCALYAGHRLSQDIDFGVADLRERFHEVREHLLDVPGWQEATARVPVLILGSMDGIEIGFRQLRRTSLIQTVQIVTSDGPLVVPTLIELLRTKAFLLYSRNVVRDYVDFAELSCLVPDNDVVESLADLDSLFGWEKQPSLIVGLLKALLLVEPADLESHAFEAFKLLSPRLKSWPQVRDRCRAIGEQASRRIIQA